MPQSSYFLSSGGTTSQGTMTITGSVQGATVALNNLNDVLEGRGHGPGACGNPECEQGYDKGYRDGQADLISELEEFNE